MMLVGNPVKMVLEEVVLQKNARSKDCVCRVVDGLKVSSLDISRVESLVSHSMGSFERGMVGGDKKNDAKSHHGRSIGSCLGRNKG